VPGQKGGGGKSLRTLTKAEGPFKTRGGSLGVPFNGLRGAKSFRKEPKVRRGIRAVKSQKEEERRKIEEPATQLRSCAPDTQVVQG